MALLSAEQRQLFAHERRWALLVLARKYAGTAADAEDAVSVAVERVRRVDIDEPGRLYRWLVRVTVNAALETRRRQPSTRTLARWQASQAEGGDPADQVCDRAEAEWVAKVVTRNLSERQREVVLLLAAGRSLGEVADHLAISYKSAESLLGRARATVRATVAASWAAAAGVLTMVRRRRGTQPALVAASAMLLIAVATRGAGTPSPPSTQPVRGRLVAVHDHDVVPARVAGATVTRTPARRVVHSKPDDSSRDGGVTPWTRADWIRRLMRGVAFDVRDDSRADRNGKPVADETLDCVRRGLVVEAERVGCVATS